MSCDPVRPCGEEAGGLGLVPPEPGQRPLARRLGDFDAFLRELIASAEHELFDGEPLGRDWDVEGDPNGRLIASLWAYVAEGVAAYTELTAAEAYLGTASDWNSLRRLGELVGYRPRPRVAARGWARFDVERGADPLIPAGTRVQAPGTPARSAQTFETIAETRLRSEWNGLTATWVPAGAALEEGSRVVRFLGDPEFGIGDRVLFVIEEQPVAAPVWVYWGASAWAEFWGWLLLLLLAAPEGSPLAVASVTASSSELGTTLVEFDRDLSGLLSSETTSYAAYRIDAAAGSARRLSSVLSVSDGEASEIPVKYADGEEAVSANSVVLDVAIEDLSKDQTVAIVNWGRVVEEAPAPGCDIVRVKSHQPVEWEVAPGTPIRGSRLEFEGNLATLENFLGPEGSGSISVYVVDRRVLARHYRFAAEPPPGPARLRLYPAPGVVPEQLAIELRDGERTAWQVFACSAAADALQESADFPEAPRGLLVDLDRAPEHGLADGTQARASGNLVAIRHGTTTRATLGSGEAARAGQRLTAPDAPIAYDVDDAGNIVPSQVLGVDGLEWAEVPTLYGRSPSEEVFVTQLGAEGEITDRFGDGERGARLPSGRNNVTATYRVGGGTEGEVAAGEITSLLGSVRGVRKVEGAGPTGGGSDQDDSRRLRSLVPARARAFDRAISAPDLVDLALGHPGVTHAAAWHGLGPAGCACGGSGLHVAFLRAGTDGPRSPQPAEVDSLGGFLDARRDAGVPLCLCAAAVSTIELRATLVLDPRREAAAVLAAVGAALAEPEGELSPLERELGQPLDRSDVELAMHGVDGVLGVSSLRTPAGGPLKASGSKHSLVELDRRPAERFELVTPAEPVLRGVAA